MAKSAKDMAWDREHIKLKAEIRKLNERCATKDAIINAHTAEIALLTHRIQELETALTNLSKMPIEDILAHVERTKRLTSMMDILNISNNMSCY